jgi:hypothetical protein
MDNSVRFLRPVRSAEASDKALQGIKTAIEQLVRQRSTLPNEQLTAELQTLMDVLVQEGRRLGWDAERALLLARTPEPGK